MRPIKHDHDQEANEMLEEIRRLDGIEVRYDQWHIAERLVKWGLIELSNARGPRAHWKRATLKEK